MRMKVIEYRPRVFRKWRGSCPLIIIHYFLKIVILASRKEIYLTRTPSQTHLQQRRRLLA